MPQSYTVEIATSMAAIDAAEWDACANPAVLPAAAGQDPGERYNPFISHAFLKAAEASKSVSALVGWAPAHVLVRDSARRLTAAAPAYLKSHSMGEFVFDFGWADAYRRAGLDYYPKLVVAAPFTPATGRRLLVSPDAGEAARQALIGGLRALREKMNASSIHVNFPTRQDWDDLGAAGFLRRTGQQFHFVNRGYGDFADFLDALASRKRKMIRRERREALAGGIDVERLVGRDITERHWDAFFDFYADTSARKWGHPYLTRPFFSMVGETMGEHILLVMAKRGGRLIAGAINFIGSDALYGRNWGAIEDVPFLHFEVCYYQALEFAIERGLKRVEAGAQGEHKLARGYEPAPTYSAHEIADPRFSAAIAQYLRRERAQSDLALEDYATLTPFRRDGGAPQEEPEEDGV
ncbi:GNAT family N-acetyltransferase [Methylocella sp.]|uniref:GNAT family N-acetyltransferase n=1 Tax=Methylocella sp. TaxID=1978226 RepID=UPI0037847AEF